jgi:hypothetical protein
MGDASARLPPRRNSDVDWRRGDRRNIVFHANMSSGTTYFLIHATQLVRPLLSSRFAYYSAAVEMRSMSFLCSLGLHRRSLNAIVRRDERYVSLCERCGVPMVRQEDGRWTAADPV